MKSSRAPFIMLILAALFIGNVGGNIYGNVFNNYLEDMHHIAAAQRGLLEIPRELPGVLSLFAVGVLFFLTEMRVAAVAMGLFGVGIAALAFTSLTPDFAAIIVWIMVASLGQHILLVVSDSIVIHTALPENRGLRLGQMRALGTAAGLFAALFVWLKWKFNTSYSVDFLCGGALCLAAGLMFLRARSIDYRATGGWRDYVVLNRKYWKYYMLETLFGARKQVFITFAFWLMVSTLKMTPGYMGKILLIAGIGGLAFQPFIGKMIQRFGEARVLVVDSSILCGVCLLYAFSLDLFSLSVAVLVITICFIADNLLFADGAARAHYIGRICERKEDITPSLYTGMAINHLVSIVCALLGGLLWSWTGNHRIVFVFAALLAVLSGILSSTIPRSAAR